MRSPTRKIKEPVARPVPTCLIDIVFPGATNHHGTLFGGAGFALMDRLAFIAATRHGLVPFVTASCDRIDVKAPATVGLGPVEHPVAGVVLGALPCPGRFQAGALGLVGEVVEHGHIVRAGAPTPGVVLVVVGGCGVPRGGVLGQPTTHCRPECFQILGHRQRWYEGAP